MTEFTTQWLIPTMTNLIASAIAVCIGIWIREKKISAQSMKGVASSAVNKTSQMVREAGLYILSFWCLSMLLTPLLSAPGVPSRWDVFNISFFTFWGCMLFLRLLAGKSWPLVRPAG